MTESRDRRAQAGASLRGSGLYGDPDRNLSGLFKHWLGRAARPLSQLNPANQSTQETDRFIVYRGFPAFGPQRVRQAQNEGNKQ